MRKLFWQISMTLDGFMEGPNHELEDTAQVADPDFERYASEMLESIDTILLGRVTYDLLARYWPAATGPDAERLNSLPKIVCSRTLSKVAWRNSRLIKSNIPEEVMRLKQQTGREIALFGSANLAATLARHGLIDEYRVLVTPVILGSGNPMFKEAWPRSRLKLGKAETWRSGIVALFYEVVKGVGMGLVPRS